MANENEQENEEVLVSGYSDELGPEQERVDQEKSETPGPIQIDRQRLGELLRRGQRYAAHVKTKVAIPELHGWSQDVQAFMNEHGL